MMAKQSGERHAGGDTGLITALSYHRVSGDDQEKEGLSLPAQLAATRRYAAAHGWAIGEEFRDVMSGRNDQRPRYQAMLEECRRLVAEGRRVVVVVCWLHRLGRKVAESVRARGELKDLGIPVHSVNEGGEVSDFVANIMASVAQYESEQIGERVQQVNGHSRANGWLPVGRVAWGYRWRDAADAERKKGAPKKVMELDPETAPWVAEAFTRVADGATVRSVATWIARLPAGARGKRLMPLPCVFALLRSPTYVAKLEHDGLLALGNWPALVDDATWQRAQERMDGATTLPRKTSGRHLLSGFLRCPQCGARMSGRVRKGHGTVYLCVGYQRGVNAPDPHCTGTTLAAAVDAVVVHQVQAVTAVASRPELRPALRRAWRTLQGPSYTPRAKARIKRLEEDLAKAKERLADAAQLLVDRDLDKEGYDLLKARIERDALATVREIARLQGEAPAPATLPPLDDALATVGGWQHAVSDNDVTAQRDILAVLVGHIVPQRVSRGKYRADVTWTATGAALQQMAKTVGAG